MQKPHRFVAIDTEVLLALEAGDAECAGAVDLLRNAGFYCLVTETPLQELADICQHSSDGEAAGAARSTLLQITNFGFLQPSLKPVELGIAERVAHDIVQVCLKDGLKNDGLILAEAAYNGCRIFLSRREVLLSAKHDTLHIALIDHDLPALVVASPAEIISYYSSVQHIPPLATSISPSSSAKP